MQTSKTNRVCPGIILCLCTAIAVLGGVRWLLRTHRVVDRAALPAGNAANELRPTNSCPPSACRPTADFSTPEAFPTLPSTVYAERIPSSEDLQWETFEKQYGIHEQSGSLILQRMQAAQYNADALLFSLQKAATMNFPLRNMTPDDLDNPLFCAVRDGEFKTEVSTHDKQTGTAFVGVKLVFPVGN
jgi:hypothetical protein